VRHGAATAALVALTVTGCAGAAASPTLGAQPTHYLVTLDQLPAPGFTVTEPTHGETVAALAGGDPALAAALRSAGLTASARARFSRTADVAIANGPIDIVETVAAFAGTGGAHQAFAAWAHQLDGVAGAVPMSAGGLGDEAHAVSVQRSDTGVQLVQITVLARVANDLDLVVVSGRYGGTRLDDALPIVQRITAAQRG
jgi:hypothetical protein